MKRLGSLLVTAALLLTLALPGMCFTAAAAEPVFTWDFEDNDLAALGTPDGGDDDGYYADGDVSIVEGGANGSNYALKIVGVEVGNGQTVTGLKSDTEYVLTFWAKADNISGQAFPNFGVKEYDGDAYQAVDKITGSWAQYTINFKTGPDSTSALIYTWTFKLGATASADFYVDDVVLTEKVITSELTDFDRQNLLGNGWSFEQNDITLLGDPAGGVDDGDNYYASAGVVNIVEGGANGSKYALKISGGEVGNGVRRGGLKSDTTYNLSFWVKADNFNGAAVPIIGVKDYANDGEEDVKTIVSDEWEKYECVFRTGAREENTSVYFFTWIVQNSDGATADLYVDDVLLVEVGDAEPTDPTEDSTDGTQPSGDASDDGEADASGDGDDTNSSIPSFVKPQKDNHLLPIILASVAGGVVVLAVVAWLVVRHLKKKKAGGPGPEGPDPEDRGADPENRA